MSEPAGSGLGGSGAPESAAVERLLESLAEGYLERLQAGELPDRQEWLSRHPEIADALDRRLLLVERMHRLPRGLLATVKASLAAEGVGPFAGTSAGECPRDAVLDGAAVTDSPAPRGLDDFELLRPLGAGSFGQVFLARQRSLGRLVALKVSPDHGGEARALAPLEHDHIVRVFSETVDPESGLRILCMQYVPGANLAGVIAALAGRPAGEWSGRAIVEVLAADRASVLDPAVTRDREFLSGCDFVEAACWLGARLADALAHAHGQGVLHRDVKPANILLHRNGRPLLADFNLAGNERGAGHPAEEMFGGTVSYMAPEHLDAFNPEDPTSRKAVDERSDIYSLGVVLFELLTGQQPFAGSTPGLAQGELLAKLAAQRRRQAPSPRRLRPEVPDVVDRVVRRCLDPDPDRRYQTAAELAGVLDGCWELHRLRKGLPAPGPLARAAGRWPGLVGLLLPLLPHLLGALVVFGYTTAWVANHPDRPILEPLFGKLALGYCWAVFPLTGGITYALTRPIWRTCVRLRDSLLLERAEVTGMRQRALRKPFWGVVLSSAGWLPGAVVLPLLLVVQAPEVAGWDVFLHYFLSFLIAGLIALTYTEFIDQFLLLRVAYPSLWVDPQQPRQTARAELGPVDRRLRVFQVLSSFIPVGTGMALLLGLVGAQPEQRASAGYQGFLLLVIVLLGLGIAGSWLAVLLCGQLNRALTALKGEG
jgi:serine/threonine protein kinase